MYFKSFIAAFAVSAAVSGPALALTVTSIDGDWMNAVTDGGSGVTGEGTDQIRWGDPFEQEQSGYDFDAATTDIEVEADTQFVLGSFTHLNFPVTGSVLESVDLAVSFTIDGLASAFTSVFSFTHNETDNHWNASYLPDTSATCADGGQNGSGANVNGCADHVTATNNTGSSDIFVIDGVSYVLEILGFQYEDGLLTDFWTVERESNTAELLAMFRTVSVFSEPPVSEVPLPASGILLLAGIAGLFLRRRFA